MFRQLDWNSATPEELEQVFESKPGDLVTVCKKKWIVDKKTTTAVSLLPYFWFDAAWEKLTGKERNVS